MDFRQYIQYSNPNLPSILQNVISKEEFDKSRKYGKDKMKFAIFKNSIEHIITLLILYYGLLPKIWQTAGKITSYFNYDESYEVIFYFKFRFSKV